MMRVGRTKKEKRKKKLNFWILPLGVLFVTEKERADGGQTIYRTQLGNGIIIQSWLSPEKKKSNESHLWDETFQMTKGKFPEVFCNPIYLQAHTRYVTYETRRVIDDSINLNIEAKIKSLHFETYSFVR